MELGPKRRYQREWRRNKPYLPKSTSLPALRLIPENRAMFTCRQCGFTNLLIPMCLWCCWTSSEAKRDFEIKARKSLRRAAFSAPRLFKPIISSSSKKNNSIGAGNSQPQAAPSKVPRTSDSHSRPSAVISAITSPSLATVYPASGLSSSHRATQSPCPTFPISAWKNQERQGHGEPIKASSGSEAMDRLGTGSGPDKCGPTVLTARRPPRADLVPSHININHTQLGHKNKGFQKDAGCSSARPLLSSSSTSHRLVFLGPCPPVAENPGLFSSRFPSVKIGLAPSPTASSRLFVGSAPSSSSGHGDCELALPSAAVPIRPMQRGAHTLDTRDSASNAGDSNVEHPPLDTARNTNDGEPYSCGRNSPLEITNENTVQMGVGVTTATQSYPQFFTSQMDHHQPRGITFAKYPSDPDMNTTNTTLINSGRRRAPIPSILLNQESTYTPTNVPSPTSNSQIPIIPMMPETSPQNMIKDNPNMPVSPPRTLKRKKRLSAGLAATVAAATIGPPSHQFDSVQRTPSPQLPTAVPVIVTPPTPHNTNPPSTNLHTTVDYSANPFPASIPALAVPTILDSSRGLSSPKPMLTQPLPRIGTPQRPYFTVIRGSRNARPASTISHLSTPPSSPTAPGFSEVTARRSPSPSRTAYPDSSIVRGETQHMHGTFASDGRVERATRPTAVPEIVTVPPLPSTLTPVPIPIPVQMYMRPSSPVRSILSVLDPIEGDDDDDDMDYSDLGVIRGQSNKGLGRRSSDLREKSGGYNFPLSLSLSLGRKRGRGLAAFGFGSERGREIVPPLPAISTSGNHASIGGFGLGRGCSMSGEIEMRMALAERNMNGSGGDSSSKFRFRENQRPSASMTDDEERTGARGGKKLLKMRSTIGLSSSSPPSSPSSPVKPRLGFRLKEMSAHLLGKRR